MLIALLTILLSGGSQEVFLIPEVEKNVKRIVLEDERKDEILYYFNLAEEDSKQFEKKNDSYRKKLKKIQGDQSIERVEIESIFLEAFEERKKYEARMIDRNLEVRKLLTDIEFDSLLWSTSNPTEKDLSKALKKRERNIASTQKTLKDIQEVLEKNIQDSIARQDVIIEYDLFKVVLEEKLEAVLELNSREQKCFQNRMVTRNELEAVFSEIGEARLAFYVQFLEMRYTIVKYSTEKEWKQISKELNKLF